MIVVEWVRLALQPATPRPGIRLTASGEPPPG
jgi:hypothetical protein